MKLTKTEQRLLDKARLNKESCFYYYGVRESSAAEKLKQKGLVTIEPTTNFGMGKRNKYGDYIQDKTPRGVVRIIK